MPIPASRPSSPIALVQHEPHQSASLPALPTPPSSGSLPAYEQLDESDVFVCDKQVTTSKKPASVREVTLFVHAWHNVEPGLLSWTFPSLRAALDAVQRMKNAIGWCVVSGTDWRDLDAARANGAVLVEQLF